MVSATEKDSSNLKAELSTALVKWSEGKVNEDLANVIARKCIDNIDLNNSILMHKGMNWFAKEILNSLKLI